MRSARTAFDLHRASGEGIGRSLARPHIGFPGSEVTHRVGGQLTKSGIRLLDVFKPGRRVEFVHDDLRRQLDQRHGD